MDRDGRKMARMRKTAQSVKKADSPGLKELSRKADEALQTVSGNITKLLRKQAAEGCITSTKLLIELSKRNGAAKEEGSKEKKAGPSIAEKWASEPEFKG